jgi:hypothetical protein
MELISENFDENSKLIIAELIEANNNFEKIIKKLKTSRDKFIKKSDFTKALKEGVKK